MIVTKVERASSDYPVRLMNASRPPSALWYRGRLPKGRAVAVVGSRAATGKGCDQALALGAELGGRGWDVVSGGAFGIDAAAHEGALAAGADTFAVLGCGVDVVYPDRHADLFQRIAASGGLLSEYPPGTQPRRGQFPARNRLIVALSDLVIVVEAAPRSGALITARLAHLAKVPVIAVPGSRGTDALLAKGLALAARTADDVEAALAGRPILREIQVPVGPIGALVEALRERGDNPVGLASRLNMPLPAVLAALSEAEIEGWVRRVAGSEYEVGRAH